MPCFVFYPRGSHTVCSGGESVEALAPLPSNFVFEAKARATGF